MAQDQSPHSSNNYRPDIDGLRAVAVLPVILFHAGFKALGGGFVGVDVFFVISGYLITTIIAKEIGQGQFSILRFYERRARRILPALFLVMLCTLPWAWLWLQPQDMKNLAQSMVAVSVFASNVFFWRASGYFDSANELKPLLHTWSLAVEEQFYVFFPLLLILCRRTGRVYMTAATGAVAIASFTAAQLFVSSDPSLAFYSLPTRAWELMIGALVALRRADRPSRNPGDPTIQAQSLVGLLLIIWSMASFDAHTPYPSHYTLAPTIGAALILASDTRGTVVGRLLASRAMVTVGLISYSAYLWHQPLFAMARHWSLEPLGMSVMATLCAATLGLAYLSWRFVETPFRQREHVNKLQLLIFSVVGSALFLGLGLWGHWSQGMPNRFSKEQAAFLQHFENSTPALHYLESTGMFKAYRNECDYYDLDKYRHGKTTHIPRASLASNCYTRDPSRPHAVLVWGDSHAQQLIPGLHTHLPTDWQVLQVTSSGCPPRLDAQPSKTDYCSQSNWLAFKTILRARPDVVVIGQNKDHDMATWRAISEAVLAAGVKKVVLAGPSPHWLKDLPTIVAFKLWGNVPAYTDLGLDRQASVIDQHLRATFGKQVKTTHVSLLDSLCNSSGCRVYFGDDVRAGLTSWDYGHLTPIASDWVAQQALIPAILR
jgi:peptidoglycan/LPS O-acetylase OafA/YrhL